tara:strand:+ start:268 stop:459 length:192 start_codon:yes stop_codon:yes gene_type:complete
LLKINTLKLTHNRWVKRWSKVGVCCSKIQQANSPFGWQKIFALKTKNLIQNYLKIACAELDLA